MVYPVQSLDIQEVLWVDQKVIGEDCFYMWKMQRIQKNSETQEIYSLRCPDSSLEAVDNFCYPEDQIGSEGRCTESVIARISIGWKEFRELIPVNRKRSLSLSL